MLRYLRIAALVLVGLFVALVLSFEGLYALQLRRLSGRPRRPSVTAPDLVLRALWVECDDRAFVSEPIWLGTILHPPGAPSCVARAWLAAHHPSRWFAGKELALIVWLSRHFTAAELAQARYDHTYFGQGAFGFEDAAARYFCKWPEELEVHELALLVGNLQAPGWSDRSHDHALHRRNFMLRLFAKRGLISEADAAAAAARPLGVVSESCFVPDRPRVCTPGAADLENLVNSGR